MDECLALEKPSKNHVIVKVYVRGGCVVVRFILLVCKGKIYDSAEEYYLRLITIYSAGLLSSNTKIQVRLIQLLVQFTSAEFGAKEILIASTLHKELILTIQ